MRVAKVLGGLKVRKPFCFRGCTKNSLPVLDKLKVVPVGTQFGAEITGINLSQELSTTDLEVLTDLFHQHKVLFFRDQASVLSETQIRLTEQLSRHLGITPESQQQRIPTKDGIFVNPFFPHKLGKENVWEIKAESCGADQTATSTSAPVYGGTGSWQRKTFPMITASNVWHSDNSWMKQPSTFTVLRAVQLPKLGGDTIFADMTQAYDDLDDVTQQMLEGLQAEYHWDKTVPWLRKHAEETGDWTEFQRLKADYPPAVHPVARTHPVTRKKSIFVNRACCTRILPSEDKILLTGESPEQLLDRLTSLASVPEYQLRYRWQNPGDMAIWDNRCTQHYAIADHDGSVRQMEHTASLGESTF